MVLSYICILLLVKLLCNFKIVGGGGGGGGCYVHAWCSTALFKPVLSILL